MYYHLKVQSFHRYSNLVKGNLRLYYYHSCRQTQQTYQNYLTGPEKHFYTLLNWYFYFQVKD